MKIDTHLHTNYSRDCAVPPETVVATAMERGLDALIVTDHNEIAGAYAVKPIAPFPVVLAEEIKTSDGEIIGLFIQERIPRGLPPLETARLVREQGGLVCVPHPFDRLRGSRLAAPALDALVGEGLLDIVEVFNSRTTLKADNERAVAYARQHGPANLRRQRRPLRNGVRPRLHRDRAVRRAGPVPGQPAHGDAAHGSQLIRRAFPVQMGQVRQEDGIDPVPGGVISAVAPGLARRRARPAARRRCRSASMATCCAT